jgi:hypothetical protein
MIGVITAAPVCTLPINGPLHFDMSKDIRNVFISTRYIVMPNKLGSDPRRTVVGLEGLIARAEQRLQGLQAKAEPGVSRLVHTLSNSIRRYRRELQKLRQADQTSRAQFSQQQVLVQEAGRNNPPDHGELPEKQDQEPRKPSSQHYLRAVG